MILAIEFPQIEPEIFSVTLGGMTLALRWYALAYIAGLLLGWRYVASMMARPALWGGSAPMEPKRTEDLLTWMVLGVIVGGRLGFVLFYQWEYYSQNLAEIPAIWRGGMSFHGGFLGVVAGIVLFALRTGAPMVRVGDAVAAAAPIGIFFGRLANFINAELWGRPTTVPWGVVFPSTEAQICAPEFGPVCARHPSQLYEAGLEGLLLFLVIWWGIRLRRWLTRPGLVIGVFLTGYGAARTLVEGFRQADRQYVTPDNPWGHVVGLGDWGLTMGQVLSLPMLAAGLVILLAARRRA